MSINKRKYRYEVNDVQLSFPENQGLLMDDENLNENVDKNEISKVNINSKGNNNNFENGSEVDKDLDITKTYSIEDAVEHAGLGFFQFKLICKIGVLSSADAMEMLLLSILGPALQCEWNLSASAKAMITTVVFIGFLLGSFFWGIVSDNYGRKSTFLVVMSIISFGGIMTAFSPTYIWLIIWRCIVGFGIGGASSSFTLLSEFLPSTKRAKILILNQIWWALGSTFEVGLAYFVLPKYGWRSLVGISGMPMILCLILILFIPESPRYLLCKGEFEKSQNIINEMLKANKKSALEGRLVNTSVVKSKLNIKKLFYQEYRTTILLLLIIWFGVTFLYYGIVLINSEYFNIHPTCYKKNYTISNSSFLTENHFEEYCCQSLDAADYKSMIISSFGEFFIIPINFFIVDYFGRTKCMSCQFLLTAFLFMLMIICMPHMWATMIMFGVRGFTSGIFNITYIYTSEVFPTSVRSTASGLCSSFARLAAIITPFVAQVLIPRISLFAGLSVYSAMAFICFISALCLPIETKGRPMPQHFKEIEIEMK